MGCVKTGLERLIEDPREWMPDGRIGLLSNHASVDRELRHARELIHDRLPGRLGALFSPQHGFFAEKQDNMIESGDIIDPLLGVPVFSLYGETRAPTEEMLASIDVLIIDLQDAGTRVYTFVTTMSYCLEAARRFGKRVVVLDRPNPVGGAACEGNCLAADCASFVGRYPIPMRHGLTIGELSLLLNRMYGIGCELEVVPMRGWRREMVFGDTGLPWVPPSPNLPTPLSAMVYPGQVIWEGTNVSEGRGTTQPFELFGAPFIDLDKIVESLGGTGVPGAILRPAVFEPTSNKWQGEPCKGFQIHVVDPRAYRPYSTSIKLLQAVIRHHRDSFEWKPPPYEYEHRRLPIDLIIGDKHIRQRIEDLDDFDDIEASWMPDLNRFIKASRGFYLYPD